MNTYQITGLIIATIGLIVLMVSSSQPSSSVEKLEMTDNNDGTFTLYNKESERTYAYVYPPVNKPQNHLRRFIERGVNKNLMDSIANGEQELQSTLCLIDLNENDGMEGISLISKEGSARSMSTYKIEEQRIQAVSDQVNVFIDSITSEIIEHHLEQLEKL